MPAPTFSPSVLWSQLGSTGMRCAHPLSPIRPRASPGSIQHPHTRRVTRYLTPNSSYLHTLPRRPSLPGHDVQVPRRTPHSNYQRQTFQRTQTYLGRTYMGLQIRFFSQTGRQWRYSYQRFDRRGGIGIGGASPGFPETKLQRVWRVYKVHIIGGSTVVVGFYVYNLEEVPVTGRRRFNCISDAQERALGEESYGQLMRELRGRVLPDAHPHVQLVKQVLHRLIAASETYDPNVRGYKWELHVIAGDEKNAFVLPGGKVFVYTGILPVCSNQDGLAAVLGHEIAHILLHHPAERMSSSILATIAVFTVTFLFDVSAQLPSAAFNLLFNLPHSRGQESEADRVGLMIMAKSCYNPSAALKFWDRMRRLGEAAPPELLSTHPSNDSRIASIRDWMYEAQNLYDDSGCGTGMWDDFLRFSRR